jgi:hypothetical protein
MFHLSSSPIVSFVITILVTVSNTVSNTLIHSPKPSTTRSQPRQSAGGTSHDARCRAAVTVMAAWSAVSRRLAQATLLHCRSA